MHFVPLNIDEQMSGIQLLISEIMQLRADVFGKNITLQGLKTVKFIFMLFQQKVLIKIK